MASVALIRGDTEVQITHNLDVQRQTGRGNTTIRYGTDTHPYALDKPRAATDVFEITGRLKGDDARDTARVLVEEIILPPLGWNTLTLDFGGLYGLDSYTVAPVDTRSARISVNAGEGSEMVQIDALQLRVVSQVG